MIARTDWCIHKWACEITQISKGGEEGMLHILAHTKFMLKKCTVFLIGLQNRSYSHHICKFQFVE